jgi:hypothetical protein
MKCDACSGERRRSGWGSAGAAAARSALVLASVVILIAPAAGAALVVDSGLSWGLNSNVFEAVNRDRWVGDTFARVEANFERADPADNGGAWHGQVRLASEQYVRTRSEDRGLLLGGLGWRWRGSRVLADWRWTGQLIDRMHADSLTLGRHQLAHTGSVPLSAGTRLGWLADGVWVNTREGGPAERWGWRVGGDVQRSLGRRWSASVRCEGGETFFDTPAIASWNEGTIVEAGEDQQDRSVLVGFGVGWSAAALIQCGYGYRTVDSNSLGYSQVRHEFALSLARLLPYRVSLQAIGLWQEPCYRDEGFAKWSLHEDPDDLDLGARSGVTLRLRRPLAESFSLVAQGAWERNEARVSGSFYERVLLLCSIRYAPGLQAGR